MGISKDMPWGTKIEMMPGKRASFRQTKSYEAIFLGYVRGSNLSINVLKNGQSTVGKWHQSFWRQKNG